MHSCMTPTTRTAVPKRLPRPCEPYGHVTELCLCGTADLLDAATVDVVGAVDIESIHGWISELSRLEAFRKEEDRG
jgi:hypothetical protein